MAAEFTGNFLKHVDLDQARILLESGLTETEVAKRMGIARSTLLFRLRQNQSEHMKPCNKCDKPMVRGAYCKPCRNAQTREWRRKNPDLVKKINRIHYYHPESGTKRMRSQLRRSFSITMEEYSALLEVQKGVCAICGECGTTGKAKRLSVDHNHTTHRVRGLLCRKCNSGIGLMNDDPERLRKAIKYLERVESQ